VFDFCLLVGEMPSTDLVPERVGFWQAARDLVKIARLLLEDLAKNLKKQDINIEVSEEAAIKLAADGYDPAFGARPMRRIVDLYIGDLVSRAILENQITGGDRIKLIPGSGVREFTWEKVA